MREVYNAIECEDHRVVYPQEEEGFNLILEEDEGKYMFA